MEYKVLLDDIRKIANLYLERDNQKEIVFDRLEKLEEINNKSEERIRMLGRMFNDVYLDALEFRNQKEGLLEAAKKIQKLADEGR